MQLTSGEIRVVVSEIKSILDLLSALFNIRTAFLYGVDHEVYLNEIAGQNGAFRPYCQLIQTELQQKCIACDHEKFKISANTGEPLLYRCHNGLYEMFLPLFIDTFLVGYLHFGQVRSEDSFQKIREECLLDQHSKVEQLASYYQQMEVVPKEKLHLIAQLFQKIAAHILQNDLVSLRQSRPEHYLKEYIETNLTKGISVKAAAAYINRSPSFVTHQFKVQYGCTFREYVLRYRVELAKKHLQYQSIAQTAQLCGFKNRYHFTRLFKQLNGVTPAQFKKNQAE